MRNMLWRASKLTLTSPEIGNQHTGPVQPVHCTSVLPQPRFESQQLHGHVTPHIHQIFNCGLLASPELGNQRRKILVGQPVAYIVNEFCEVADANEVHTKLIEAPRQLWVLDDTLKLRPVDLIVLVHVDLSCHPLDLEVDFLLEALLLCVFGHVGYDVYQNADEHVHQGEQGEQQERHVDQVVD